jgi:small-conductance mechanosensitive channel/CRP-like cAMP-binding protein
VVFVAGAPLIYLGTVALGRWLKRKCGVQLGLMYKLFGACLGIYLPMKLVGWDPLKNETPFTLRHDLRAGCFLLGVFFVLALIRRYLWEYYFGEKRGIEIPKFLREIVSVIVFCVSLVLVVSRVYGGGYSFGVLLPSTVVVGIVGWAMQDLLGNVISGVALQIGKPFKSGDWLIIENHHAEVIEINWRSTKLRTTDDHYIDVPNTAIVRSTIVNLSYPSHLHAMRLKVGIAYDAPPNHVKQILMQATLHSEGVLSHPPPKVFLMEFGDSAISYEIKFWINHHAAFNEISDELRTRIWYGLQRAGIAIPFPIRTVQLERKRPTTHTLPETVRAAIRGKPFFKCLSDHEVEGIVTGAKFAVFGRGERIVEQGAEGSSMFILLTGEAGVYVRHEGNGADPTRVATLSAGEYFGEMSLLTGEHRSATIVAASDCEVLEIAKAHLARILQENGELLTNLSEMLAQRRLDNESVLASNAERHTMGQRKQEYAQNFLQKLASVFDL